jgi:hypothetical protein
VITAGTGTHYVAEAAKVIEGNATDTISLLWMNWQKIFNLMNIDTHARG